MVKTFLGRMSTFRNCGGALGWYFSNRRSFQCRSITISLLGSPCRRVFRVRRCRRASSQRSPLPPYGKNRRTGWPSRRSPFRAVNSSGSALPGPLDPIATAKIENLIDHLTLTYTIIIVTHNMEQARRCADQVAFFYLGEIVEVGDTDQIFTAPQQRQTRDYITGRMG